MKIKGIIGLTLSCLIWSAAALKSQVVLNEICFANYNDYVISGEYEDWVELHNPSGAPVNIGGFWLSDDPLDLQKWSFPAGTTINANGFLLVLISGRGDYDPGYLGQLNTNFKLRQTAGEALSFSNAGGVLIETFEFSFYSPNQRNHSWGRSPDGSNNWRIHTNPSQNASNGGPTAADYAAKPNIDVQAGYYAGAINVNISTSELNSTIYYTLNGTTPTNGSTLYSGPINLNTTSVLKAIVYSSDPDILPSLIETNTYFFGTDSHGIMVVSLSGSTLDGGWNGNELADIEFFNPQGTFIVEAHGDSNEHGNDSNAYGQRGFDYIVRDELGYDNTVDHALFPERNRGKFDRLIFKAAANDNYPFSNGGAHIRDAYVCQLSILGDLHLDERATRNCIVYINGQYWGVYEVREKVDDTDFTKHYYDQPKGQVDFLKTWGGTWAEYSAAPTFNPQANWNSFVTFCTTNSMADPANYAYAVSQYNPMSLIDYFILNGYTVCTDWLNWNTAWWRGYNPLGDAKRWRYALWDNDATFGHYINYTGVPSTAPTADPCQIEGEGNVGGQGHIPVLNAMFDSPEFMADYVQRYAELSNGIFSCQTMIHVLDSMIDVITPEMPRQIARWGGNLATWENNVQDLRDFILARCPEETSNNDVVEGIEDCYDVTQHLLTVQINGPGVVFLEDTPISVNNAPYTGTFFAGNTIDLPINITAESDGTGLCSDFIQWVVISGTATFGDPTNPVTTVVIGSDAVIEAQFGTGLIGPIDFILATQPANAGVINWNGTAQGTLPFNTGINGGDAVSASIVENPGFVFDHWETNNTAILPSSNDVTIDLVPCLSDTLYAVLTPVYTLDIIIDGWGEVNINGANSNTGSFEFLAGEVVSIEALLLGVCSDFISWELVNGNGVITSLTNLNSTIALQENVTLVAHFNSPPTGAIDLVVTSDHPLGGSVNIVGNTLTQLPATVSVMPGISIPISVSANDWYAFNSWSTLQTPVIPNNNANPANITVCGLDTLWVVYDYTSHHLLTIDVFPPGAGVVDFDGIELINVPFTQDLQDGVQHHLGETPADQWSVFDHWESNGHVFTPSATDSEVDFTMSLEDTITAVYNLIPHSVITVMLDQPNTGSVVVSNGVTTRYAVEMDIAHGTPLEFTVSPDRYYDFVGWTSQNFGFFNPDTSALSVEYVVQFPDTIIAHVQPEIFAYFIPNSFSPNGDNINDCIGPVGNAVDVEKYHLVIYGRHGEVVFETDDFNDCWNGAYQSGEYYSHNDVYCYEMIIKSVFDKEAQKITGSITLVR